MLSLAGKRTFINLVSFAGRKSGMVGRFIAGEDLDEAVPVVQSFERQGIKVTLDLLGEGVTVREEAESVTGRYLEILEKISEYGLGCSVSLKLTQLGLNIDRAFCRGNLTAIVAKAKALRIFIRIDMEDSSVTQATLDLFWEQAKMFGTGHLGIVIQSYLYRSEEDIRALCQKGCNIRLCKGAYMESARVAFPRKADVDENFIKLSEVMLSSKGFSAIATHDEKIIDHLRKFSADKRISFSSFEFQMLYGVRRNLQLKLREEGYNVRVYVPFGTEWAPYYVRRLAERPANVIFMMRHIVR